MVLVSSPKANYTSEPAAPANNRAPVLLANDEAAICPPRVADALSTTTNASKGNNGADWTNAAQTMENDRGPGSLHRASTGEGRSARGSTQQPTDNKAIAGYIRRLTASVNNS